MTRRLVRQVKAAAEAMEKQAVSVAAGGEDGGDGTLDTVTQTSAGVDPSLVRRRALTADADKMTEDTDAIVKTLHAIINTLHADAIVFTLYAIVKTLHTDAMTPSQTRCSIDSEGRTLHGAAASYAEWPCVESEAGEWGRQALARWMARRLRAGCTLPHAAWV
jgi:hypothetical protein